MNSIPYNASLQEVASLLEREGAPAFERLDAFQRREVIERLEAPDADDTIEGLQEIAGEAIESAAESLESSLEKIAEQARAYLESQDYLGNYEECIKAELSNDATRERLATLLEEELTLKEYESLADEISIGLHDGIAPNCPAPEDNNGPYDRAGPFGVAYDIWSRDDALITLGPGGDEQAFPVDNATEKRLGELLDLFNRLDEVGEAPKSDFFDLFSVTLEDGGKHGLDAFAVMVQEPEQILFYVDLESISESLADYRREREDETRERLEALREQEEKARANWPQGWREFLAAYREAIAWSTNDTYNGEGLESLEAFEFGEQALEQTAGDCLEFIRRGAYSLEDVVNAYGWSRAGYDFWMTRADHGVGYWDRDELASWPHAVDFLCNLCEEFGEQWPYIGENNDGDSVIFVR